MVPLCIPTEPPKCADKANNLCEEVRSKIDSSSEVNKNVKLQDGLIIKTIEAYMYVAMYTINDKSLVRLKFGEFDKLMLVHQTLYAKFL